MRRLMLRGYPAAPKPLQPSASLHGGLLPGYTFDYAQYTVLGTHGSDECYEIKGWYFGQEHMHRWFRAWYHKDGRLVQGYGEAENRIGPYPDSLSRDIITAIAALNTGFMQFSIRTVLPVDRQWECAGCGARFMSEEHGGYYRTCPDHRIVPVCDGA